MTATGETGESQMLVNQSQNKTYTIKFGEMHYLLNCK